MEQRKVLDSWKEIAAYLDRNSRTCMRWEQDMGLPVHRLDGSPRARVFAYPEEIDRWLEEKVRERGAEADGMPKGLPAVPFWTKGLIAGLAAAAVIASAAVAFLLHRQARVRWANDVAIPEIERLLKAPDARAPYDLLQQVERIVPRAPELVALRTLVTSTVAFTTEPPGAFVWIKDYGTGDATWRLLGSTPVPKTRVCQGYKQWRAELRGFEPVEGAFHARAGYDREITATLGRPGEVPEGMVRVQGGSFQVQTPNLVQLPVVDLQDFFIDRYEVTNRQYKRFVDAGGYDDERYWKQAFVKDGRVLPRKDAMRKFVDATGRPGPAAWSGGTYPDGQDDYPVSGVSWYEASAYAEFAGKKLPSLYHWEYAAGNYHEDSGYFVPSSNFDGQGPAPAGRFKGLSPCGAYDMAGNVKEWCWNEIDGKRLIRGGAWNETEYMFVHPDNYPPFMRAANFGFRCMKEMPGREAPGTAYGGFEVMLLPDFPRSVPCSDEVFEVYRRLYDYTRSDLAARIESVVEWSDDTVVERVTFDDAAGEERITAYLFLPRRGRPPFQTIVYFPGDSAYSLKSVFEYGTIKSREVELFTRSGRAFVFPVYRRMFERARPALPATPQRRRDAIIRNYRDLARCLDYLETRPDIDRGKFAYQGLSGGGAKGIVFAALEKRFKAAVLMGGGLFAGDYIPSLYVPERDLVNFAPRVRLPVLMQNGRYDYLLPPGTAVEPLFALLGSSAEKKKLVIYETGHSVWFVGEYRKDIFDFLDKYLGPVKKD